MDKFKQAQIQNKMSIERHLEINASLNSSSEDEDETHEDIEKTLCKVLSAYKGEQKDAEKILSYLINVFQSGGAICLICISTIKKSDSIWNCDKCFSFIHLSCILHWIQDSLAYKRNKGILPAWGCPKCRTEYTEDQIPRSYRCFCKKVENPAYQVWFVPHSCGEICGKSLKPNCGHSCVLLCHPGPCPPCAKVVVLKCYCGKQSARPQRCNVGGWSCGNTCNQKYLQCIHKCKEICHTGECSPCSETLLTKCHCKNREEMRNCNEAIWTCETRCDRLLSCNKHNCEGTCHAIGDCETCPPNRIKTCPCGKKQFTVACKEEQVSTCGSTCGKLLNCSLHFCNMRCHSGQCGQCLEVVTKLCRCGSFKKEVACGKEFHCNKKCTQTRLCGKHLCNKKCCDCIVKNNFNICEKVCDNILNCKKHKCSAPCHSGPCYPCMATDTIYCRCGSSKITVPCGTKKKIKPPLCNKPCKIPYACSHVKRNVHKCHQGACPPCKNVCGLIRKKCGHACEAICHNQVWVKINANGIAQPKGPWEKQKDILKLQKLPCSPCEVPVQVTCFGGHETRTLPCHVAKVESCGRSCGRVLACTNHNCELMCHTTQPSINKNEGTRCMDCEKPCSLTRPDGCSHSCQKGCHPAPCDPCKQLVRVPCHCGISTLYRYCTDLTNATAEQRDVLLKCGNQCPKNYPCGHRCIEDCHSGLCRRENECSKKVKLWCKCKRIKKEFSCLLVREKGVTVECDNTCELLQNEKIKAQKAIILKKQEEEKLRNQQEIEKFERKFKPRRKFKDKLKTAEPLEENGNRTIVIIILTSIVICISAFYFKVFELLVN